MGRRAGIDRGGGKAVEGACRGAAIILGKYDKDIPFALLYVLREDGASSDLVASAGWQGHSEMDLPELSAWPIDAEGHVRFGV